MILTWSGLRPGGTQVYSSKAHPLSSSLCECRWWWCCWTRASCTTGGMPPPPGMIGCTGLSKLSGRMAGWWWDGCWCWGTTPPPGVVTTPGVAGLPGPPPWKPPIAIGMRVPGARPGLPTTPPCSEGLRWCSSRGHRQLLHTFLKSRQKNKRTWVIKSFDLLPESLSAFKFTIQDKI